MNLILSQEVIKFIVAGGIVAVSNVVFLYFFVNTAHLHYLLASSLSFLIALVLNFLLQKYWAFKGAPAGKTGKQFFLFLVLVAVNFHLNLLFMFLFVERFSIQYLLAQIFTTIILAAFNFFVYQRFIFSKN